VISDYDPAWPSKFRGIGDSLRRQLDGAIVLRIDHIGSTAVPGLAAKDLIDVQLTVGRLDEVDEWPDELLPGLTRRPGNTVDHVPSGAPAEPAEWTKRYWSDRHTVHVHVREQGRLNQRYALMFRDYLRADATAAGAYGQLKRALAEAVADDWDAYYAVKDPACDLIISAAEHWAVRVGWIPAESDA
jgi:GrpB-like predicted nucleotidyltransferase (UPF0157 family)